MTDTSSTPSPAEVACFMRALAAAYMAADDVNRAILTRAFETHWREYALAMLTKRARETTMQADILRSASALSQAVRRSTDPLRTLSSVLGILAQGTDHDEMCIELDRLSADAQTYAEMRDEQATDEHALMLECAADRRDEWETERRERRGGA